MIGGITIPAFDAAAILIVLAAVLGYINRKRCERPTSREDGGSRSEAARIGGVGLQTVRDWVLRFNRDGPDGLVDGKAPGGRPRLDATQRAALAAAVESGPIPAAHGVVRWRLVDLVQWIRDEFAVSISTQTLSRDLRAMGYRKLTARPRHHAQDADAIPAFKKTSPPKWQRSGRRSPAAHP